MWQDKSKLEIFFIQNMSFYLFMKYIEKWRTQRAKVSIYIVEEDVVDLLVAQIIIKSKSNLNIIFWFNFKADSASLSGLFNSELSILRRPEGKTLSALKLNQKVIHILLNKVTGQKLSDMVLSMPKSEGLLFWEVCCWMELVKYKKKDC